MTYKMISESRGGDCGVSVVGGVKHDGSVAVWMRCYY